MMLLNYVPFKWMASESLRDELFNEKSDVMIRGCSLRGNDRHTNMHDPITVLVVIWHYLRMLGSVQCW